MELFDSLRFKIVRRGIKIVFPEATDARILGAAARLKAEELVEPILVGNEEEIRNAAHARGIKTSSFTIISPDNYDKWDEMVDTFVERRNGKASKEQAEKILKDVNYFGTMLTYMGIADGMVSGAIHSTGDTVRPALQIIKTKPGISRTSGAMIMVRGRDQEKYVFSDCAINVNPTAQELAEIAVDSAKTAWKKQFITVRIILLKSQSSAMASPTMTMASAFTALRTPTWPKSGALASTTMATLTGIKSNATV